MKPVETDPTVKAEALRIADAEGPAAASRRTGVPSSTIRMWRTRAKQAAATSGVIPADLSTERAKEMADSARSAAGAAIRRLNEILPTAKNPQSVAISLGICVDKAILLDSLIQGIEDREVRLNAAAGEQLAALLELYHGALGIPVTPSVRAALRELLTQAGRGGTLSVSPATAELARADVRAAILADERGLPAPDIEHEELAVSWTLSPSLSPNSSSLRLRSSMPKWSLTRCHAISSRRTAATSHWHERSGKRTKRARQSAHAARPSSSPWGSPVTDHLRSADSTT